MSARRAPRFDAPERLEEDVRAVWDDVVANGRLAPTVTPELLEAYCTLVVRWRDAAARIAKDGLVVDAGEKRGAVVHPALSAERQLAEQLREWAPLINQTAAVRKRGPMYDATKASIKAAGHETRVEFKGACEAVLTLAWLIDEAQRAGIEALQKASFVMIPSYLKGCAELQITPASIPPEKGKKQGAKVTKFQRSAGRGALAAV